MKKNKRKNKKAAKFGGKMIAILLTVVIIL